MSKPSESTERGSSNGKSGNSLITERNWLDYLFIIKEHWILALLVALSASGFYVYRSLQSVPLYKSSAITIFELQKDRVINIEQVVDTPLAQSASYIIRNHLTDLRSNTFRARIVDSLTPDERELIIKDYRSPEDNEDPSVHGIIANANQISLIGGNIFNFEFHHRNPQAAALLSNRFTEEFNDFLLERARKTNEAALRFLRSQSEELKLKVERSELAVQQYRQERNLVSLEESQNLIVDRMKTLSNNLNSAKVELLNLTAALEQIQGADMDLDRLAELPSINQMGTLPAKFERRNQLLADRSALSLRYGQRHPRMIENTAALEALETDIRGTLEKNVSDFIQKHKSAQARMETLQTALSEAEREALELDQIAIEYNVLRRKLETDKRLFTQVHTRLNEAILASQLSDTNLRVVDRAWPASEPFTPDTKKIYSIAAFLFLFCFTGVPFGIHYLNLNLKTATDIEQQLQIPFLGEIRKFPRKLKKLHRLVLDQTDPQAAELFRQIHSQLLMKIRQLRPGHTFVVTSAIPKEGKSFFAINLAASFSRHHYKTLLIDCDFRRPSIASRMKEEFAAMADAGDGEQNLLEMSEKFHVLPSNKTIHEATEWIESEEYRRSLDELRRIYDIIVIDTPPAGLFPDAAMIGNHAEHFIFLTQLSKHRKAALKGILNRLQESRAEILGMVVNKVSRSKSRNLGVYRYADYSKYKNYYPQKAGS
jgi:capsular exopolysaccharide synthesis family protein